MPPITLIRLAPLTGVLFVVLVIAAIVVAGEAPESDEATDEVVRFWVENDTKNLIGAVLGILASIALVWFGGSVRAWLRVLEGEPGRVTAIAFGGFLVMGAGLAMFSGFQFAAAQTADDVPPEVTHTLAVLGEWFFAPFAVGVVLAFLATAVVTLRHGGLPRWLAYVAILLAIVLLTPAAFIGFIGGGIWILIVSVLLFLRGEPTPPAGPGVAERTPA